MCESELCSHTRRRVTAAATQAAGPPETTNQSGTCVCVLFFFCLFVENKRVAASKKQWIKIHQATQWFIQSGRKSVNNDKTLIDSSDLMTAGCLDEKYIFLYLCSRINHQVSMSPACRFGISMLFLHFVHHKKKKGANLRKVSSFLTC